MRKNLELIESMNGGKYVLDQKYSMFMFVGGSSNTFAHNYTRCTLNVRWEFVFGV